MQRTTRKFFYCHNRSQQCKERQGSFYCHNRSQQCKERQGSFFIVIIGHSNEKNDKEVFFIVIIGHSNEKNDKEVFFNCHYKSEQCKERHKG